MNIISRPFWFVTKPLTRRPLPSDLVMHLTIPELYRQFKGGLKVEEILGIYDNQQQAETHVHEIIEKLSNSSIGEMVEALEKLTGKKVDLQEDIKDDEWYTIRDKYMIDHGIEEDDMDDDSTEDKVNRATDKLYAAKTKSKKKIKEDKCNCNDTCCTDTIKESPLPSGTYYMGQPGEKYFIDSSGTGSESMPPSFYLIHATTSDMVDMTFSSPEEATKYADKKGLVVVPRPEETYD